MKKKIVITGITGRVGQALLQSAKLSEFELHAIVRDKSQLPIKLANFENIYLHSVPDLSRCEPAVLAGIFQGAQIVIHLAAQINENVALSDSATVKMAHNVAEGVKAAGVPRILNLSSISATLASSETSDKRQYGQQKLAAENCIFDILNPSTRIVTLRPPAVYGKNMLGPFHTLTTLVDKKIPLPLRRAISRRDYISSTNLVDLIITVLIAGDQKWQRADRKTYEPCDGQPINTRDLIIAIAGALDKEPLLIPMPLWLISFAANIVGKSELAEGALSPITATGNSQLLQDFGWQPVEGIPESLSYLK